MSREFGVGVHRRGEWSAVHHLKGLEKFMYVPLLRDEVALRSLANLKPEEKMEEAHVR